MLRIRRCKGLKQEIVEKKEVVEKPVVDEDSKVVMSMRVCNGGLFAYPINSENSVAPGKVFWFNGVDWQKCTPEDLGRG